MLLQLHWQNRNNLRQTEFVAQGSFEEGTDIRTELGAWLEDVMKRRGHECPEGWVPMVCTEDSDYFEKGVF